jgi:hypothetical protein
MLDSVLDVPDVLDCNSKPPNWELTGRHRVGGTQPESWADSLTTATNENTPRKCFQSNALLVIKLTGKLRFCSALNSFTSLNQYAITAEQKSFVQMAGAGRANGYEHASTCHEIVSLAISQEECAARRAFRIV